MARDDDMSTQQNSSMPMNDNQGNETNQQDDSEDRDLLGLDNNSDES